MADREVTLLKGNEAIAHAAIRCGVDGYFGYPITPQTEVSAYMSKRMPKIGGTFLQAESEVAAINMVLGAASTGARVMTSSPNLADLKTAATISSSTAKVNRQWLRTASSLTALPPWELRPCMKQPAKTNTVRKPNPL